MKIVIHCSDSPQGRGDDAATIHRWHLERDFSGIGYHFVVLEDGTRQSGRPVYWQGAHCQGHNSNSIAICLIGQGEYTEEQYGALTELLRELLVDHPQAWVVGHYELDRRKGCPMFDVPQWLESRGFIQTKDKSGDND